MRLDPDQTPQSSLSDQAVTLFVLNTGKTRMLFKTR